MNKIWSYLVLVVCMSGCTRYDNPAPNFEEYEQEAEEENVERKILIVAVDGLVGLELKKAVPANLTAMMANAKYSFESLADENTSDPASWGTLATGVNTTRHRIITDSYIPAPDPLDPHKETPFAPSFLYMIKERDKRMSTAVITQSRDLSYVLLLDAKETQVAVDDEAVKTAAIEKLKDKNVDLLLTQFTSVLSAGKSSSFSSDSPTYKAAIEKVDGLIGDLKKAVEARATYDKEEWLIIVVSTHGGTGNSYGGSTLAERNTFTMYYNKWFKGLELKSESIYAPRFYGYDVSSVNPTNAMRARNTTAINEDDYNVSKTKSFTIEAKIKVNKNASGSYSYSWPPFLSKVNARSGNTAGWSFFRSGDNVNFFVADGASKIEIGGGPVGVGEVWSHITGVFTTVNEVPTAKFYVNGELTNTGSASLDVTKITSTSPLTLGFQQEVFSSAYFDFYMNDVHIWNTALTDAEVADNAKRIGVPTDHPKMANLVGYWSLNDGGKIFKNKVTGKPDLPVWGPVSYRLFGNNLPYVDPAKAVLMKSQDISSQVMYWLQLQVNDDWKLEGDNFLRLFELEFLK